jgi:hypothetical protein
MRPYGMILVAVLTLGMPGSAFGKSFEEGISRKDMVDYLTGQGMSAKEMVDEFNKEKIVRSSYQGVEVDFYFFGCTDAGKECVSVQIAVGWAIEPITDDKVMQWNRTKRYMRAYLTESGKSLYGEMDFYVKGTSTAHLDENIGMFRRLFADFKAHFGV